MLISEGMCYCLLLWGSVLLLISEGMCDSLLPGSVCLFISGGIYACVCSLCLGNKLISKQNLPDTRLSLPNGTFLVPTFQHTKQHNYVLNAFIDSITKLCAI